MFCAKCGKEIKDDMRFCAYCGSPVVKGKPEDVLIKKQDKKTIKDLKRLDDNTIKKLFTIVSIAVVIGVILICIFSIQYKNDANGTKENLDTYDITEQDNENSILEESSSNIDDKFDDDKKTYMNDGENIDSSIEEQIDNNINFADGPIFIAGDSKAFTLSQYNLINNKWVDVFSFRNPTYNGVSFYDLATNLSVYNTNFYKKNLFNSEINKLAVGWREKEDNSNHVGWIDNQGNVTDVSNIIHPSTNSFSSIKPKDHKAFFTSTDRFVFHDANNDEWCYYNLETGIVEKTYSDEEVEEMNNNTTYNTRGLDYFDIPTGYYWYGPETDSPYSLGDNFNHKTLDYKITAQGAILFDVKSYSDLSSINVFGPGVTETNSSNTWDYRDATPVTDETQYYITSMAYYNDVILFTGLKGGHMGHEKYLFKTIYSGEMSQPEIITEIEPDKEILFWNVPKDSQSSETFHKDTNVDSADMVEGNNGMDNVMMNDMGIDISTIEDYSANLDPSCYRFYDSGIGEFYFSYPMYLFNEVSVDDSSYDTEYGSNIKTIHFRGSKGSELTYSLYDRTDNASLSAATDYFYQNEHRKYHDLTDIVKASDDEKGRLVFGGVMDVDNRYRVYDLIKIEKDKIYRMLFVKPNHRTEEERVQYAYVIENVYRMCGFSGSTKAARSYSEFLESNP